MRAVIVRHGVWESLFMSGSGTALIAVACSPVHVLQLEVGELVGDEGRGLEVGRVVACIDIRTAGSGHGPDTQR